MQAINRIQNAMINANAAIQGALVVDSANAHRAYPSFVPCDPSPVVKCPGKVSSSSKSSSLPLSQRWLGLEMHEQENLAHGPAGKTWRLDSQHGHTPATIWATLVLNRTMCG